jgi:hypothetical protein
MVKALHVHDIGAERHHPLSDSRAVRRGVAHEMKLDLVARDDLVAMGGLHYCDINARARHAASHRWQRRPGVEQ